MLLVRANGNSELSAKPRLKRHWQTGEMIMDHSVFFAFMVGACFFLIFFAGSISLGRKTPK
jgi:hypothetical protein